MRLRSKLPKGLCRIPVVTFKRSHLLTDTNNTVLQDNSSVKLYSNSQNSDFLSYMGGKIQPKALNNHLCQTFNGHPSQIPPKPDYFLKMWNHPVYVIVWHGTVNSLF